MIPFTVANFSPTYARQSWFPLTAPWSWSRRAGEQRNNLWRAKKTGFLAVLEQDIGIHGTLFNVVGRVEKSTVLEDTLEPTSEQVPPFVASDWVTDDLSALVITIVFVHAGAEHRIALMPSLRGSAGHSRLVWNLFGRAPTMDAFCFEGTAVTNMLDDVVELKGLFLNSNVARSSMELRVEKAWIECEEVIVLDSAAAFGFGPLEAVEPPLGETNPKLRWKTEFIRAPTEIGKWTGIPIRGAMLCVPQRPLNEILVPGNLDRLMCCLSRKDGTLEAMPRGWDSREWLAPLYVAQNRGAEDRAEQATWIAKLNGWSNRPGALPYDARLLGQLRATGTTGSQEQWCISKSIALPSLGSPAAKVLVRDQISEPCRPTHYRELDGSRVTNRQGAHPDLVFYTQVPHYDIRVSPDRLGMPYPTPPNGGLLWTGKDEQHGGSDWLDALFAISGDELLAQLIGDEIEANMLRSRTFLDAGRAQGRCLTQMANHYLLTADEDLWECMMQHCLLAFESGPSAKLYAKPECRVRPVYTAADDRLISRWDPDYDNGEGKPKGAWIPQECWSVWDNAIASNGYRAVLNAGRLRKARLGLEDGRLKQVERIAWELAATVTQWGFYRSPSFTWNGVANVVFEGEEGKGTPINPMHFRDTPVLKPVGGYGSQGYTLVYGGGTSLWSWQIAPVYWLEQALSIAKQMGSGTPLLGYEPAELDELHGRCWELIKFDRSMAKGWSEREWRTASDVGAELVSAEL